MQCLVWTLTTSLQESFLGTGTFLKKEKALDKFEYLTFQVTTLFCLTCVVGAYYLQLPYKVWNESQTRKVYCTLKDTFLHFFCSSCPSLWGSYRRPSLQDIQSSLGKMMQTEATEDIEGSPAFFPIPWRDVTIQCEICQEWLNE